MNRKYYILMTLGLVMVAGMVYEAGAQSFTNREPREEEIMIIANGSNHGIAMVHTKMNDVPYDASIDIFSDAVGVRVERFRKFPREDKALGLEIEVRYGEGTPTSFKIQIIAQDGSGKINRDRYWNHEIDFKRMTPRKISKHP